MAIANNSAARPAVKPADPRFSAGPTKKRPGWSLDVLKDAALGRSHRSALGKLKLKTLINLTRDILGVPQDHRIAIVPASDAPAFHRNKNRKQKLNKTVTKLPTARRNRQRSPPSTCIRCSFRGVRRMGN